MKKVLLSLLALTLAGPGLAQARAFSDQDISDAYIYLLGRLLVMRQQQLDFKEGFKWNELVHRKPGAVDWPNPNLDVAYSEAWVAADENSCTIVSVPKVEGATIRSTSSTAGARRLPTSTSAFFPSGRSAILPFAIKDRRSLLLPERRASICR